MDRDLRDWLRSLAVRGDDREAVSRQHELSEDDAACLERIATDGTLAAALAEIAATGLLDLILATGAPPVDAGGEVLGLMHAGATPRDWSVIEYLIDRDTPRTAIGVQILTRAVGDDELRGYMRDAEGFEVLLSDYSVTAPEPTWRLVNQLGGMGVFLIEDVARSLAATRD